MCGPLGLSGYFGGDKISLVFPVEAAPCLVSRPVSSTLVTAVTEIWWLNSDRK